MGKFKKVFRRLPDPRADNAQHKLLDVLFIALAALLCGAETCSDMAEFGRAKESLLRQILDLEHGIPSHDTGCSACSTRRLSRGNSGGSWRPSPNPTSSTSPASWRSTARPCAAP